MSKKSLCAIILAAGNSSRFGQNKLLFPINNRPMYSYTFELIKNYRLILASSSLNIRKSQKKLTKIL